MKTFLLLVLAASAAAVPLDNGGSCSRQCTESGKYAYQRGTTYSYNYETRSETSVQGTTRGKAAVVLTCQVDLHVLGGCDFALELRDVRLEEEDPENPGRRKPSLDSAEFKRSLEAIPLRFSFQDGRVDVVCPGEGDTPRAINIKRGVLSLIQNSMSKLEGTEDVVETDVSGTCPTVYQTLPRGWSTLTIRKAKDLALCKDRENSVTALQASAEDGSKIRSLPIVKGNQECKQTYRSNILESAECRESHLVRPFSRQENGAVTKVSQVITLKAQRRSSVRNVGFRSAEPTDLLFDHGFNVEEASKSMYAAEESLRAMVSAAGDDVQDSAPRFFTDLVYNLRKLSTGDLQSLYRRAESMGPAAKKIMMDALPAVGSSASVRLMADIIVSGQVSDLEANLWLTSLAFVSEPTLDTIDQALPLLKTGYSQAPLAVSSMAHAYCRSHADCASTPAVKQLVHSLYASLGSDCNANDIKTTVMVLKALGNLGESEGKEEVLERCIQNPELDVEVRLEALKSFRRLSCAIPRNRMLDLYKDMTTDPELRIGAYMAAMNCPSRPVLELVKETLRAEKIKQVGSFVYSHVSNMAKDPSPFVQQFRSIANEPALRERFNLDFRKYSRNGRYNFYFDDLNAGFEATGNLVYTPDSYLPRSADFGTSFDVFGKKVNLFEMGARAEQLEKIVQRLQGKEQPNEVRARRGISDNRIDEMSNKLAIKSKYSQESKLSAYLRLFGNEIAALRVGNVEDSLSELTTRFADPKGIDVSKSVLFADSTLTLPASNGFPLRLAVNGSASAALKVGGKSMLRDGAMDLSGHIRPSGAVELSVLMTVDGHKTRAGVRMAVTMSSSWVVDGLLQVKDGKAVKAQLNMPRDEMRLVDVKSKIFLVNSLSEREYSNTPEKTAAAEGCTGKMVERVAGVKICGRAELPVTSGGPMAHYNQQEPLYPFSGNAELSLTLKKTDPTLRSYNFEASWNDDMESTGALLSMNTPGTAINREITAQAVHNKRDKTLSLRLKTPPKDIEVDGKYNLDPAQPRLDLQAKVDSQSFLTFASEMKTESPSGSRGSRKFRPFCEVTYRGQSVFLLNGQWSMVPGRKYSGNLNIERLTEQPIEMKTDVDMNDRRTKCEASIKSFFLDGSVNGFVHTGDAWSTKMSGEFSMMQGRPEKVDFTAKFRDLSAGALVKYSSTASFQNTLHPALNSDMQWDFQKTEGQVENTVEVNVGGGRGGRRARHTVKIQQIARYLGDLWNNNADLTLKMEYPQRRINWGLEMKHENTERSLSNRMTLDYAHGRQLNTLIDVAAGPDPKADVQIRYPGRDVRLTGNYNRISADEHKAQVTAEWERGKRIEAAGILKTGSLDKRQYNPKVSLEVSTPWRRPVVINGGVRMSRGYYAVDGDADIGSGRYEIGGMYKSPASMNHEMKVKLQTPRDTYSGDTVISVASGRMAANANVKLGRVREISLETEVSAQPDMKQFLFDIKWDVSKDPSRRASITAESRRVPNGYQANFAVQCPKQNIRGTVSTTIQGRITGETARISSQGELEWLPRQKASYVANIDWYAGANRRVIRTDLQVQTPYKSMDKVGLTLNHNDDGREWSSEAKIVMPGSRTASLASDGHIAVDNYRSIVKGSLKLATPEGREMAVVARHDMSASDINDRFEINWERGRGVAVGVTGSTADGAMKSKVELSTPFRGWEKLYGALEHSHAPGSTNCKIEAQWRSGERITVDYNGKRVFSRSRTMVEGVVSVATPFRGLETLSSKLAYNNDGKRINAEAEMTTPSKKILTGIAASRRKARNGDSSTEARVFLTSPVKGFENLEATGTYATENGKFKLQLSSRLPYAKTVSLRSQGKMMSLRDFNVLVNVQTPIRNYEKINFELTHTFNGRSVKTNGQLGVGSKKATMELVGDYSTAYSDYDLKGHVLIATPLEGLRSVLADIQHGRNGDTFGSSLHVTNGRYKIVLEHDLTVRSLLNFNNRLHVESPFGAFEDLLVTNTNDVSANTVSHNSVIEMAGRRISLAADAASANSRYEKVLSANVELLTPWSAMRHAAIKANYKSDQRQMTPSIAVQWNEETINFDAVHSNYMGYRKVDSKVSLKSSLKPIEDVALSVKYDLTTPQKSGEVIAQWNPRPDGMITVTGTASINNRAADIDVSWTTPFRDYERVQLLANYRNDGRSVSGSTSLQSQWRKTALSGEWKPTPSGASLAVTLTTPYRGLRQQKIVAEYGVSENGAIGQLTAGWANKQVIIESELKKSANGGSLVVGIKTPFEGMRQVQMELTGSADPAVKRVSAVIQRDANKMEAAGSLNIRDRTIRVEFRSPIEGLEEMLFNAALETRGRNNRMTALLSWARGQTISVDMQLEPGKSEVTLKTPFRGYRQLTYTGEMQVSDGFGNLNVVLEAERRSRFTLTTSGRYSSGNYEGKVKITTPYESFDELAMSGSLRMNGAEDVNLVINLKTPVESLKTFDLNMQYKNNRDFYSGELAVEVPNKRYEVKGEITYLGLRMINGQASLVTPHEILRSASLMVNLRSEGMRAVNGQVVLTTPGGDHAVAVEMKNGATIEGSVVVRCMHLPRGRASVAYQLNKRDSNYADMNVALEFAGQMHRIEGSYENKPHAQEAQVRLETPLLERGPASLRVDFSSRRSNEMKAMLTYSIAERTHTINVEANRNRDTMRGKLNVDSDTFGPLSAEGLLNMNDQGFDVDVAVKDARHSHLLTANWKRLSGTADAQIKIECPLLPFRSLTGSVNLRNERSLREGSIILQTPRTTFKTFAALRGSDWRNMEGNLKIETPYDVLRFANVDASFSNEYNRMIDASVFMKTSRPSLRDVGFSVKTRLNPDSLEVILDSRLPSRSYPTVRVSLNCKHTEDLSSIAPRLTITLPNARYVTYGELTRVRSDIAVSAGHEWNEDKKMEAAVRIRTPRGQMTIDASLKTPFRKMENYVASLTYAHEAEKRVVSASFKDPSSRSYEMQSSMTVYSLTNFNVDCTVNTPIRGMESLGLRLLQQSSRSRFVTSVDGTWARGNKMTFNLDHDRKENKGTVIFNSPFQDVRSLRMLYRLNRYKMDGEVVLNENRIIKAVGAAEYLRDLQKHHCSITLDVPALRTNAEVHYKPLPGGIEFTAVSNTPRRNVNLKTVYQRAQGGSMVHLASLKWGEGRGEEISYDIRSTEIRRRDLKNTDVVCKVNFPLRSFEVRTANSERQNVRTMSCDVYWDAARDPSRHVTLNVEHQDMSNRNAWAHKISTSLSHPSLTKDIVMRLDSSLSSNEAYGKAELEYSHDQAHNLMMEARLKNHSPGAYRGVRHYSAELTARQPVSITDLRARAELKNDRGEGSALFSVTYMDRRRQMKVNELKASVQKLKQAVNVMLRKDREVHEWSGQMYNRDLEYGMAVEHKANGRAPVRSHVHVSKRHSNMEIALNTPDNSGILMTASTPKDRLEFAMSHKRTGSMVSDVLVKMGLKEGRYIGSEINWRPELADETTDYLSERYTAVTSQISDLWNDFSEETGKELQAKRQLMSMSWKKEMKPLINDLYRDIDAAKKDLAHAVNHLRTMYHGDELYLKTTVTAAYKVANAAASLMYASARLAYTAARGMTHMVIDNAKVVWDRAQIVFDRLLIAGHRSLILVEHLLGATVERTVVMVEDATEWVMDKAERIAARAAERMVNFMERYGVPVEKITSNIRDQWEKMADYISDYTSSVMNRVRESPFISALRDYASRVWSTLAYLRLDDINAGYYKAADFAYNVYDNVLNHPNVQYVNDAAIRVFRRAADMSEQLGISGMLRTVAAVSKQQAQEALLAGLDDAVKSYGQLRAGLQGEYDPMNGRIVAEVRLPSSKSSLAEALDITSYPEFKSLADLKDRYQDIGRHALWDMYYRYRHQSKNLVPPYKARAMVAGSQHYRTFDGFHFEFAGECSYLLSKDFLNDNFAVIINYVRDANQRVTKKSITVTTGEGKRFDIASDYKVTMDGQKVELPQETSDTVIKREGHSIIVQNKYGLNVRCNLAYDHCITEIDGEYFGKTAGLFGTYDYEDHLDMRTPDQRVVLDPASLAGEWEVGQVRCRRQNMADKPVTDPRAKAVCSGYFEGDDSIFRSCFKLVDPAPYGKMCLHDMASAGYADLEVKVCVAAAAYREECRNFGVEMEMPRTCARCEKPDGTHLLSGEIVTVTEPVNTADIVFVVERKQCNRNVIPNLIRLAQGLEERYQAMGFDDLRHAVVGFGGQNVAADPHVVTADGQIFSSIRSVISAFGSMTANLNVGEGKNVLNALQYAANLPMRMASTKILMLVKCSPCKPDEENVDYTDIYRTLVDRGMYLHVLENDDISVRTAAKVSKSKRVFGVDARKAYTVKDMKDLRGDADLHSQIRLPKDYCVPLALETNGTMFSTMRMFDKRQVNKKFIDVLSRRVVMSEAPECQICECLTPEDGVGRSLCNRCAAPYAGPIPMSPFTPAMYEEAESLNTPRRPRTRKLRRD